MDAYDKKEKYVIAIGPIAVDEYYDALEWPKEGAKEIIRPTQNMVGGMIPNAACVFAGYGVKTYLADTLKEGSENTELMLNDIRSYGLNTDLIRFNPDIPDAKTYIIRTAKERTILVIDSQKPQMVFDEKEMEIFRNASYIYTTPIEISRVSDMDAFIEDVKSHGAKIVFDVEASTVEGCSKDLIYKADILFLNEFGFEKIKNGKSDEDAFKEILGSGVEIVTITMGELGSYTVTKDTSVRVEATKQEVVDTTGAGDTYNSSFITYLLMGKDIKTAAEFANTAGGYAVTKLGPKAGVNDIETIEALRVKHYA